MLPNYTVGKMFIPSIFLRYPGRYVRELKDFNKDGDLTTLQRENNA